MIERKKGLNCAVVVVFFPSLPGDDLFLIARRDVDGKYDWGGLWDKLPFEGKRK